MKRKLVHSLRNTEVRAHAANAFNVRLEAIARRDGNHRAERARQHKVARAQRLAQGVPQRELAQMAGISPGALRKLEHSAQSSLETLVRTAQALGLVNELDDLFVFKRQSIAQMEKAQAADQRQRAPRRKNP